MKRKLAIAGAAVLTMCFLGAAIVAAIPAQQADEGASGPAITIYNQNFAVIRQSLDLDLKPGINNIRYTDVTAFLEPDSVMLRDPLGRRQLQVLEQNFRNDPVSQELLLSMFEGKTIDFRINNEKIVPGKIIRSGYMPRVYDYRGAYGNQYAPGGTQPIIEIDGHLQFGLPGQPLFPALGSDTVLKPTLHWLLATDKPGKADAELSYLSGGMRWEADYNVVAPEKGDVLDLIGWITMDNTSGPSTTRACA